MSDVKLPNLPWRAGTKTAHGTYHPATVFDANDDAVLHFYDIPLHKQLEDIDRKRYGKTLDTIAATLTAVNSHARLIEALEAAKPFAFFDWVEHPTLRNATADGLEVQISITGTSFMATVTVGQLKALCAILSQAREDGE